MKFFKNWKLFAFLSILLITCSNTNNKATENISKNNNKEQSKAYDEAFKDLEIETGKIEKHTKKEEVIELTYNDTLERDLTIPYTISKQDSSLISYVTDDWIDVNTDDSELQIQQIERYIIEEFFIEDEFGTMVMKDEYVNNNDFDKIIKINQKWINEKAFEDYNWFEKLTRKQSEYLNKLNNLNNAVRKLESKKLERNVVQQEIDNCQQQMQNERIKLDNYNTILDSILVDELHSKLRTIPLSTIIIGRYTKQGQKNEQVIRNTLVDLMKDEAIKKIKGINILKKSLNFNMHEQQKLRLEETTLEGIAQTMDTYYRDIKDATPKYLYKYLIHRIEVYPFDKPVDGLNASDMHSENQLDIYKTYSKIKNEYKLYDTVKDTIIPFDNYRVFSDDEIKKYLDSQEKFSYGLNIKYKTKIKKAISDYREQRKQAEEKKVEIELNIQSIDEKKIELENNFEIIGREITALSNKLSPNNSESNSIINVYNADKDNYEKFYKKRISYTNKLVIEISGTDDRTPIESYKNFVHQIYQVIDELAKASRRITIYSELSSEDDKVLSFEKSSVRFKPNLLSYKVLSIDTYEDEITKQPYNSMNLAFKIKWNYISPLISCEEPLRIIDEDKNLQWVYPSTLNPTSYKSFLALRDSYDEMKYYTDNGWRLPTIYELNHLKEETISEKETGNDCFEALGWDIEPNTYFLTSESTIDENGFEKCKCLSFTENSEKIKYIDAGGTIYLLFVKECEDVKECCNKIKKM